MSYFCLYTKYCTNISCTHEFDTRIISYSTPKRRQPSDKTTTTEKNRCTRTLRWSRVVVALQHGLTSQSIQLILQETEPLGRTISSRQKGAKTTKPPSLNYLIYPPPTVLPVFFSPPDSVKRHVFLLVRNDLLLASQLTLSHQRLRAAKVRSSSSQKHDSKAAEKRDNHGKYGVQLPVLVRSVSTSSSPSAPTLQPNNSS